MAKDFNFHPGRFKLWKDGCGLYDLYNEVYFGRQLPVVKIGFYKMRQDAYGWTIKLAGAKYVSHILLNPTFRLWPGTLEQILIHEMCHVKLNNVGGHGPKFQKEKRRLILAGAFDDTL